MASRRFALVAPSLTSAATSRYALLSDLHKKGHRILCIAPEAADQTQSVKDVARLATVGGAFRPISYDTPGLPFLNSYRVHTTLNTLLSDWKPDCVLGYGPDVLSHSTLAAKRAKAPRVVSLCNDLPNFLKPTVDDGGRPSRSQFRRAMSRSDHIVFHNADHQRLMHEEGLLLPDASSCVVAGQGVDVETQDALALPNVAQGLVFLMAARSQTVRGVYEYIQAARRVSAHAQTAKFLMLPLCGRDELDVASLGFSGDAFEVLDGETDLRTALGRAHVYVYPSHCEGMPWSVLQALAAGRPVITTDTPGCRDTIDETVNGYLVPRGEIGALTAAMDAILKRPDLIPTMARASRLKAERRFDVRDVNRALCAALEL